MKKRILISLSVIPAVGLIVGLVLWFYFPEHYIGIYPLIPLYYLVIGIVFSALMYRYKKTNPRHLINIYMLMRTIKFGVTLGSIVVYEIATSWKAYGFVIMMMSFYFLYLIIETYLYYIFEKRPLK